MFKHRIQDGQELAHAGSQSHLLGLARPTKPLVKGLDDRVIPAGRQGTHIESSSDPGASAPNHSFATKTATVSIEGSTPTRAAI